MRNKDVTLWQYGYDQYVVYDSKYKSHDVAEENNDKYIIFDSYSDAINYCRDNDLLIVRNCNNLFDVQKLADKINHKYNL